MGFLRTRHRGPKRSRTGCVQGLGRGTPKPRDGIPLTLARCCSSCRISWAFCSTCSAPRRVSNLSMNTRYAAKICAERRDTECHPTGTPAPELLMAGCPPSATHAGCWSLSWCPHACSTGGSPPHLLALLILSQVEGPFRQGQPILVDLGGDGGSGLTEVGGGVLGKVHPSLPWQGTPRLPHIGGCPATPGAVEWQHGGSAQDMGSCASVSLLLEGARAAVGWECWARGRSLRHGLASAAPETASRLAPLLCCSLPHGEPQG